MLRRKVSIKWRRLDLNHLSHHVNNTSVAALSIAKMACQISSGIASTVIKSLIALAVSAAFHIGWTL
jgi:hypothetical protein